MGAERTPSAARLRRLVDELAEDGFELDGDDAWQALVLNELDYALRPTVHERRVPSYGSIIAPTVDPSGWGVATELTITRRMLGETKVGYSRLFADAFQVGLRASAAIAFCALLVMAAKFPSEHTSPTNPH